MSVGTTVKMRWTVTICRGEGRYQLKKNYGDPIRESSFPLKLNLWTPASKFVFYVHVYVFILKSLPCLLANVTSSVFKQICKHVYKSKFVIRVLIHMPGPLDDDLVWWHYVRLREATHLNHSKRVRYFHWSTTPENNINWYNLRSVNSVGMVKSTCTRYNLIPNRLYSSWLYVRVRAERLGTREACGLW